MINIVAITVCVAALLGGTAANASSSVEKAVGTDAGNRSTDLSAQRRHHGSRHHRGYGFFARRPYYAPRGYYAQPYYGQPYYGGGGYGGYGYGGPGISLGFGGGHFGGYGGHHGGHHGGHYGGHH